MMPVKLNPDDLHIQMVKLPDWALSQDGKCLMRSFRFTDFAEAFSFMTRVALMCERMNHHPGWSNLYNRVDIALTTHDCDGVSENDVRLARAITSVYSAFSHQG